MINSQLQCELPPLIELQVYQETYCDQQMTDTILQFLWETKPDLIAEIAGLEERFWSHGHDAAYMEKCGLISEYLTEEARHKVALPDSRLGMLDLYYEMSRRIRKAKGLVEIPVLGKSFAPRPEGPFPALIDKPIYRTESGKTYPGLTQEIADRMCQAVYDNHPSIMYEYAEQYRRMLIVGEILVVMQRAIKAEISPEYLGLSSYILSEIRERLFIMCERNVAFKAFKERALS